jgi:spore germination protein GerM
MRHAIRRSVVSVVLCSVVLTACGVRSQSEPQQISSDDVPFGLVEPRRAGGEGHSAPQTVSLYFLGRHGVVTIRRQVEVEPTPARALRALLAGPLSSERASGTASALVSPTAARLERVRGGIAHVALESDFRDSAIGNQPAALAEIVYTLTEFPQIRRVSFSVDGSIVAVPTPDGSLTTGPVGRKDYAALFDPQG